MIVSPDRLPLNRRRGAALPPTGRQVCWATDDTHSGREIISGAKLFFERERLIDA
jgi:hypothetical protein